ncbi:uncharacterized protein SETTUDRAFT_163476, partial [Exserohilum turcica Et28A]
MRNQLLTPSHWFNVCYDRITYTLLRARRAPAPSMFYLPPGYATVHSLVIHLVKHNEPAH